MPKSQYALVNDNFNDFRSQHIRVKVATSTWEKQGYFELRKKTFAQEQKILPLNETDEMDFQAIPIVALASSWSVGDEIAGAVRIYREPHAPTTWFGGRLCVQKRFRGHQSIGKALINEAVSRAKDHGCTRFLANVQAQNERYFHSVHWKTLHTLDIAGKAHVRMEALLESYPFMPRDPS